MQLFAVVPVDQCTIHCIYLFRFHYSLILNWWWQCKQERTSNPEFIHTHTATLYVWASNLRLRLFGLVARLYTVAFPVERRQVMDSPMMQVINNRVDITTNGDSQTTERRGSRSPSDPLVVTIANEPNNPTLIINFTLIRPPSDVSSFISSTATMSNLPGPGRVLGLLNSIIGE